MRPSFLGLIATGFLHLVAIILIIANWSMINAVAFIEIVLLLCISIGIHSMLHFNEEFHYGFNPLAGKWTNSDEPQHTRHMNMKMTI